MVKFYANRVRKELATIEEVPSLWRTEVKEELAKDQEG